MLIQNQGGKHYVYICDEAGSTLQEEGQWFLAEDRTAFVKGKIAVCKVILFPKQAVSKTSS